MKTFNQSLVAITLATAAGSALANEYTSEYNPISVRAEAGTMGYGAAVSYNVHPKVGITFGYNGGDVSWSNGLDFLGSEYDVRTKSNNVYLNAELRPFENPFYVAAGVGYLDTQYALSQTAKDANSVLRKINGKNYQSLNGSALAHVQGTVDYDNTIAPYLGIGFSPTTSSGLGFFGEVGAYYAGNPEAFVDAKNLKLVGENGQKDAQVKRNLEHSYSNESKYEWLPVAKLGVTYRF